MRFWPCCPTCAEGGTTPNPCAGCPEIPDALFATFTMPCAGYAGDTIALSRYPILDDANRTYWIGTLPATCGTAAGYVTVIGCDNAYLDKVLVSFGTDCTVLVQFVCSSSGGVAGASPDGTQSFVCPGDMTPVDVTVTLDAEPAGADLCCENQASPGTVQITE